MSTLISLPILLLLSIVQTSFINRFPLLQGVPDLTMLAVLSWSLLTKDKSAWAWGIIASLFVGFYSEIPFMVYAISYLALVAIATYIKQQIWKKSYLSMLILTIIGTLFSHLIAFLFLILINAPYSLIDVINYITMPSLLLNILLAIPFFVIIQDVVELIMPIEIEA